MLINKGKQIRKKIRSTRYQTEGLTTTASTLMTAMFYYIWFNKGEIGNHVVVKLLIIASFSLLCMSVFYQAQTTYFKSLKLENEAFNRKIRDRLIVIKGPTDPREKKLKSLRIKTKKQEAAKNRNKANDNVIQVPFDSKR